METSDALVVDDDDGAKPKSTSTLKEKKKKLKAIYRKRALGNLSFRNTVLNSTMFKASLKINNRALAQALERKKGELRTIEEINLRLREENQALMADVNQAKMVAERTKQDIHRRLIAVSCTMQLAVEQLVDAIDACTSGDFLKLSDALARAEGILPTSAVINEVEKLPSLALTGATESHTRAPSRILASSSEAKIDQNCGDDDLDVDDVDEEQDASSAFQNDQPPNEIRLPASNLSLIAEQSYFIPNEADFSILDTDFEFRNSSGQDRRNQFVFRPLSLFSPLVAESSETQNLAPRNSRSRSRHTNVLIQPDEASSGVENSDVNVRRSQDRRNVSLFRPSSACDSEDSEKERATLRRSSSRPMRSASRDRDRSRNANTDNTSRLNDSLHLRASKGDKKTPLQDETFVGESVAMTTDLEEQVNIYKDLVRNGEIEKDQYSLQFVDETFLCDASATPSATAAAEVTGASTLHVNTTGSVTAGGGGNFTKETTWSPGCVSADTEETVFGGQFVTRDRIPRTPVKASACCDEGKSGHLGDDLQQKQSFANPSDSSGLNLDRSERDTSLTKRDIPTFVPIISSPRVSASPAKRRSAVSAKKAKARPRGSFKNAAESSTSKAAGNFGKGKPLSGAQHNLCAATKADAAGKMAAENGRPIRRGTFVMKVNDLPLPGEQENGSDSLTDKNATILMSEDMEQTGVRVTTIVIPSADEIGQQLTDNVQTMNSAKHKCDGAEDEVLAGDSNAVVMGGASGFGTSGTAADSQRTAHDVGDNLGARGVDGEVVEQLSQTVKRRKINPAKLKLAASCEVPRPKNKDSGFNVDNLQENIPQNTVNIKDFQFKKPVEPPNSALVVIARKRPSAYVSKPGNFVLTADTRGAAPDASTAAKKTRSRSRTLLPLLPFLPTSRPKSSATVQPEENVASVCDFRGTTGQVAATENDESRLSVYDFSPNDSSVIPKRKEEEVKHGRSKNKSRAGREFSKDDSSIVDKPKKVSRRKRHESTNGADHKMTYEETGEYQNELLESPDGILLALERKRKPSAQSKTVCCGNDESEQGTKDNCSSDGGVPSVAGGSNRAFKLPDSEKCGKTDVVENDQDSRVPTVCKPPEHVPAAESTEMELNARQKVGPETVAMGGDSESQTFRHLEVPTSTNIAERSGARLRNKGGPPGHKIVRGKEGGKTADTARATKAARDGILESNGGLPRGDGTDRDSVISKAKEQSSNVEVSVPESQRTELQPEGAARSGNPIEEMKVERRTRKRRAVQDMNCLADEGGEAKLQAAAEHPPPLSSDIQPSAEDTGKDQPEALCGSSTESTSSRNRKNLPDLLASGKARNKNTLSKNMREHTPKGNPRVRASNGISAKTIPAPKNRSSLRTLEPPASDKDTASVASHKQATSSANIDPPKSSHQSKDSGICGGVSAEPGSHESSGALAEEGAAKTAEAGEQKSRKRNTLLNRCSTSSKNASPRQEPSGGRSRRAATHTISYKEPTMNKKLRQGDPFTSTIYNGSSHN